MMSIPGSVPITGFLGPTSELDLYPTHKPKYGLGGLRSCLTLSERDSITNARREIGMEVFVISESKKYRLVGQLDNSGWVEVTEGGTAGSFISTSEKGVPFGVAPLGPDGIIESHYLPSYLDDVVEFTNATLFPSPGETGKIYVALDTNNLYRWSGSIYINISNTGSGSIIHHYEFPASLQWVVTHNMNTTVFIERLTDSSGNRFMAGVQIINSNQFVVNLTSSIAGSVDVIFNA